MSDKYEGHTEGPWCISDTSKCHVSASEGDIAATNFRTIAATHCGSNAETNYANARLIAAAPDLLAENKKLREALEMVKEYTAEPLNAATANRERHINNTVTQALQETE